MSSRYTPRHRAAAGRRLPRVAVGAVAAAVAGVLLLGGQGSLAYWTARSSAAGGSLGSGSLALGPVTCQGWQLIQTGRTISGTPSPNPTPYTNQPLEPNDVLTMTCTSTLTLRGDHIRGSIAATGSLVTTPAGSRLVTSGNSSVTITPTAGAAHGATFTGADNGATVTATVTLTIPSSDGDGTSGPAADATVSGATTLRLTATQVHA